MGSREGPLPSAICLQPGVSRWLGLLHGLSPPCTPGIISLHADGAGRGGGHAFLCSVLGSVTHWGDDATVLTVAKWYDRPRSPQPSTTRGASTMQIQTDVASDTSPLSLQGPSLQGAVNTIVALGAAAAKSWGECPRL